MTRQVALSERAYAELQRLKGTQDSFSDVILRLIRDAGPSDAMAFCRTAPRFAMPVRQFLDDVAHDRAAERDDAWDS